MTPINIPLYQSTIYSYDSIEEMREVMLSGSPYFYMRSGNKTVAYVADKIAQLEHAEDAILFSSGMAAITCALTAILKSGDHIIVYKDAFSQTISFVETILKKYGVFASIINVKEEDLLNGSINDNTRVIYIETPSNPKLNIIDIVKMAEVCQAHDCLLLVDSTYATPVLQNPLLSGADLVIHSATKFMGGHADIMGGVIAGRKSLINAIRPAHKLMGAIMDPQVAFLLDRGLKTLNLRMEKICENALQVAKYLSDHTQVNYVNYPYLPSDINYAIAKSQMSAGGGVLSFELKDGLMAGRRFINHLKYIKIATSLGSTESIIEIPYDLKRYRESVEEDMGLVRLSVGIDDIRNILGDITLALEKLTR